MVEWISQFYQNLSTISKFLVWCWTTSRASKHPNRSYRPTKCQQLRLSRSSFRHAQHNWSPAWTIRLHAHYEVKECKGRNYTANGTISGVADTDHTVTTRRHSPRYAINFLDSQSTTFDRFWEIADIPPSPESQHASNELECIRHFDQITMYGPDERAMIRLPINNSQGIYDEINHEWLPDIGHSARKAFRQFFSNERNLRQNRAA